MFVWARIEFRHPPPPHIGPKEGGSTGKGGQQDDGAGDNVQDPAVGERTEDGGGQAEKGPIRPRSGTWSVATSRRVKIKAEKEEEAAAAAAVFRQRRKSGDDVLASAASSNVASARRKEGGPQGFFDSFRPRSKSDARAILAARQRRKSGDDVLNATVREKEKKKEPSPGFFEYLGGGRRPRSKSDASRVGKKPNILTSVKNAVQHTLVSPVGSRGGRRSGDVTPVEGQGGGGDEVYYTWHAGAPHPSAQARTRNPDTARTGLSKVMELFRSRGGESSEERQRRKSGGVSTQLTILASMQLLLQNLQFKLNPLAANCYSFVI
ncbi:hypothetical protein Pcinc_034827 [Petrolisthes cinctipes]|uniref:Uncharacterized protein n=1 Tax=Petrolisthes cinctipes TaxID=88211 RepID=A0AAE1EP81_PETCI|nr:hypothetical protein Pcinc_034827 [Petrolisthes cinctipes]